MSINEIFTSSVQTEITNRVVVKVQEVTKLVRKAINNEKVHWFWNGVEHFTLVSADTLRHKGSNYDDICKAEWYKELKQTYGEAIHLLLKSTIMNKINSAILNRIPRELSDYQKEAREFSDNLRAQNEALEFEIHQLQDQNAVLTTRIEEVEIKNFDLEVEVNNLSRSNAGLSDSVQQLIAQAQKTVADLENTRVRLNQTQVEFDKTQIKFDQTQVEFDKTKVEFDKTKVEFDKTKVEFDKSRIEAKAATENLAAANRKIENLEVEVKELKEENVDIRARLDRLENMNLDILIEMCNIKEAEEIAGNVTRDLTPTLNKLHEEVASVEEEDVEKQIELLESAKSCKKISKKLIKFLQNLSTFLCVATSLTVAKSLFADSIFLIDTIENMTRS